MGRQHRLRRRARGGELRGGEAEAAAASASDGTAARRRRRSSSTPHTAGSAIATPSQSGGSMRSAK